MGFTPSTANTESPTLIIRAVPSSILARENPASRAGPFTIKSKTISLSERYVEALRLRLDEKIRPKAKPRLNGKTSRGTRASALGAEAVTLGLETLDLARIHEQAVFALTPGQCSPQLLRSIRRQSSPFFLEALTPIEDSNRRLKQEIVQRQTAEAALIKSEQHHRQLLAQSRIMEERLRLLSRQVLFAQEEERKKISRELHDQIAQMLAGINVHLATVKGAAFLSSAGLNQKIRNTHRMVEKSVRTIHRFARELRPPVLDDLGLIPALQSYLKGFTARNGILARVNVSPGIEQLHSDKRTVLYRVALAALTNVAQHARASRVTITLVKVAGAVQMHLHDDGKSFDVEKVMFSTKNKRLGLIGMRERVEMVGGSFNIESAPGQGTTLGIQIPFQSNLKSSSS